MVHCADPATQTGVTATRAAVTARQVTSTASALAIGSRSDAQTVKLGIFLPNPQPPKGMY